MTPRRVARALAVILDLVVLTASGAYLIVYLYRWEWNRAVVSGIFFIITEVALLAMVFLARLTRIERRLERERDGPSAVPAEAWRTGGEVEHPFAWLGDGQTVFVPVLIGVGAILSAVAYVVEHLASATTPVEPQGMNAGLETLDPPAEPLVPVSAPDLRSQDDLMPRRRPPMRGRAASAVMAGLVLTLLLVVAINSIAEVTQNRPDAQTEGTANVFELQVSVRDNDVSARRVADALWVACRANLPHQASSSLEWVHGRLVRMRLEPAIGHNARRRFIGCVQDLTVEGALARVTGWALVAVEEAT